MKNLEVLAPSGDMNSFITAINNGADAVYLGLNMFNARAKAENFNIDNIRDIVKIAHFYSAKVYLTVNILINDNEFEELKKLISVAVKSKVDAFIVQDLGVAKFLQENFKGIVLHASTQLGVHNLYGAKVLEKLGFTRVVLSRETTLEDIKEIHNNTNLEIEFFVQGALCTCFSGNCYISSLLSNESGNRGRCLQYCRMGYSAYDKNGDKVNNGYLLSSKDLSLLNNLENLITAGVTSFKIEGRLRRAGYVGKTVEVYRNAIDSLLNDKKITLNDYSLRKVFVRGKYNKDAYLFSNNDNIIEQKYNNHSGIVIGKVINVSPFKTLNKIEISSNLELKSGDGLKFYDNEKEVGSLGVGNIEKTKNGNFIIYSKTKVNVNSIVHLILDKQMELESENNKRYVKINFKFSAFNNKKIKLEVYNENLKQEYESDFICELAKNNITSKEEIENQLSKTKDYGFIVNSIQIEKDEVFLPKSVLNNIRRNALELFKEYIIENNEKDNICYVEDKVNIKDVAFDGLEDDIIIVKNINQLKNYISKNDNKINICLKPDVYNKEFIKTFYNNIKKLGFKTFILYLPIFANYKDLKNIDDILNSLDDDVILLINNIYGLYYLNRFKIIAGTGLNIYNKFTVLKLKELNVYDYISSIENNVGRYNYSYGYFPLMTFVHCPFKLNYKTDCENCSYSKGLSYKNRNNTFKINRLKNISCQFELLKNEIINKDYENKVIDITNVDFI